MEAVGWGGQAGTEDWSLWSMNGKGVRTHHSPVESSPVPAKSDWLPDRPDPVMVYTG